MTAQFVIGIDLGTTNSVVSYVEQDADNPEIRVLEIPQWTSSHTVENRLTLPSFCYLPTSAESADGAFSLPWSDETGDDSEIIAVGQGARLRSAETPDRTVGAAKSWLCNSRIDRRQPVLPWNSPEDVRKLSPVSASQKYLEHLTAAWNYQFPEASFSEQQVVLTVPASFDPVARDLTREAALAAGFPEDFVLLEEPQAALYAWLNATGESWRKLLKVDETVLVFDVGGGTTDLTLIRVVDEEGNLTLKREAVGNHLLVGGDNMDLALAYHVAEKFREQGVTLDPWQSISLWHSCRSAKEELLAESGPPTHKISILGRGSRLIGGTQSVEIDRQTARQILLDGFLPSCDASEPPQNRVQSGFQEIGLPYESDPRITVHVAAFLNTHSSGPDGIALPDHILFNGGVFKAEGFRARVLEVFQAWSGNDADETTPLEGEHDLDYSVARGACYYGWCKANGGTRIRGGVPASYYVGIETAGLAIPGAPRPLKALCVVPFGMEEGSSMELPSAEFGLILGQPVHFRFFCSHNRKEDQPGVLLNQWQDAELQETDPLEANLELPPGGESSRVPVQFQSRITELGVFELWCLQQDGNGKWKLEFSVREDA